MIEAALSDRPIKMESLIRRLVYLGPNTDEDTVRVLLRRREESLPRIIRMVRGEDLWDLDKGYSTWAPICAVHLLSAMGGKNAIEAVVDAIGKHHDEVGDWITEDAASVLAAFGTDAFDALAEMISDRRLEEFCRGAAARALLMISKGDSEVRQKSIALLRQVISNEDDSRLARSILVDEFAEFKDRDSLELIKSLFERGLVDTSDVTYEVVLRVYAGEYDDLNHSTPENPLGIFKRDPGNFYRKTNKSTWLSGEIGRNHACPCGSGRKFKKCCMMLK